MSHESNASVVAAKSWRQAGERLLDLGATLGPASEDEFGGLSESAAAGDFDRAIEDFKGSIEGVLGGRSSSSQPLSVVGALAVVDGLLELSEQRDFGGLSSEERVQPAREILARYEQAMAGETGGTVPPVELPKEFEAKLDALQRAGADEVIALGTSKVLVGAITGAVTGLAQIGGPVVQQAFEAVAQAVNWFRAKVFDFLKWLVERLRSWLPEPFREVFDERLADVKQWVQGRAGDLVADSLGEALGRQACEDAWAVAQESGRDLAPLVAKLDETLAEELKLIADVGSVREKVDGLAAKVLTWVAAAAPQARIVIGVVAVLIIAVVMYQVDEGFDQVRELVAEV